MQKNSLIAMITAVEPKVERTKVPALAMANRFKGYKPEDEKLVRKVEVVEDKTLKRLKAAWKELQFGVGSGDDGYVNAVALVKPLNYSASDVEKFSIALAEFQDEKSFGEKAGIFLSALINNGNEQDYVVHTNHLSVAIDYLGVLNRKNITVEGDAGKSAGEGMKGGSITVKGNAGACVGEEMEGGSVSVIGNTGMFIGNRMNGGSITVHGNVGVHAGSAMKKGSITVGGNAGDYAGQMMKGGSIKVNGSAGWDLGEFMEGGSIAVNGNTSRVGHGMKGGEIHVEGKIGIVAVNIQHGKIFHKGKLIVDR